MTSVRVLGLPATLGFALAYVALVLLGRGTVLPGSSVSLVWPAAGVAVLWLLAERPDTQARVPEADRERVFDRFHRSEEVQSSHTGIGLGLSLCRTIAPRRSHRVRRPRRRPGRGVPPRPPGRAR